MPNWCSNSVKLLAANPKSQEILHKIREECTKADPRIFELIVPCPEELWQTTATFAPNEQGKNNLEKYGYSSWYNFTTQVWGTKWDACDIELENINDTIVIMHFDTAWSPPMGIYRALEEAGFVVEATYCERGVGYIGYLKDGEDHEFEMELNWNEDGELVKDGEVMDEDDFIVDFFSQFKIDHHPYHLGG